MNMFINMFIDSIKIKIEAGKGGDGCVSFRREKGVPKGGPNGGDGGKGGDVILEVDDKYSSLSHLCYISHFKADNGQHGKGKNMHGKDGKDLIILVPPGTLVYKINEKTSYRGSRNTPCPVPTLGEEVLPQEVFPQGVSPLPLIDLVYAGNSLVAVKGGRGGRGNARFKTSTNQAPRTRELGSPGEKVTLLLELKLIADIGLVGYPNAGKSTLLARISNAKPKIASYPFTTLMPNLGILKLATGTYCNRPLITIADIPGIIEGAHQGKGLGLEFLRHIERTSLLIFVLDITQDPLSNYNTLRNEIREYNPRILNKAGLIVLNKIDLLPSDYKTIRLSESIRDAIPISALKGDGIDKLISSLQHKLTKDFI